MTDFTEQVRTAWQPSAAAVEAAYLAYPDNGRRPSLWRGDVQDMLAAAYAADTPRIVRALWAAFGEGVDSGQGGVGSAENAVAGLGVAGDAKKLTHGG